MGNEQSFNNKIPLKIKKYNIEKNIGKEIDDLITAGRFFVQFKYLLENDCNLNIINNTNINVSININNYNNEIQKKDENNSEGKDIKDKNKNISKNNININNIMSHIPKTINEIKSDKGKEKIFDNSKNKIRGMLSHDKPIIIKEKKENIENININQKIEPENESFKVIDYIEFTENENSISNKYDNKYDTFCLGIFISGLSSPIQITSIIENSDNFISPCRHKECSMFPSIPPSLLNTFINSNSKDFQNLSQLVSNMCFPLGIKPCFNCKFIENRVENAPDPQKTFFNVIKNERNESYYIATLQYFIKMTFKEYMEKYKFNPVDYVLEKMKSINNKDKKFKNSMKNLSNLINTSQVLIPESVSLISKYPFFMSMEKCLRCIISLNKKDDMDNLVNHLINEVPSPKKGYQIQFFIPKIERPIILNYKYNIFLPNKNDEIIINNDTRSCSQINMKILLDKISIENIILIFQLLILEQKILMIENDYQTLSEILTVCLELIYPLIWVNPFIPILSTKTVRFLESPVPFVMGIDEYLLQYAIKLKYVNRVNNLDTGIILFNIMTNEFIWSKKMKKISKKDIFKEFKLPIMNSKIREFIEKELKEIKKKVKNEIEIDKQIRTVFLKSMIMLMGDYNNFIFYTKDEIPLFSKDAFVQSHKEKSSQLFLSEMVKTQIFNQFLLNEKQISTMIGSHKLINSNIFDEELVDTSYFKKLIAQYQNLVNSEKIRNRAFSTKKIKRNKKNKYESEDINIKDYIINNLKEVDSDEKENTLVEKRIPFDKMSVQQKKEMSRVNSAKKIIRLNDKIDIKDLNKKTKEKEKEIKFEEEEIKIILLYPYYINKASKNLNEITIDDIRNEIDLYSKKNNMKYLIQNLEHVFIRHSYEFNNIPKKRKYLYSIKNNYSEKRNSINSNLNNNKTIIEKEKEKKKEIEKEDFKLINDIFKKCYTNKEQISKSQLNLLEKIFLDEDNKKFFAELIFYDIKLKKKKNHKLLTSSSFEDLSKILRLSLEHLTSNEYNTCRLLTISSFVYYKIYNKKIIYLYENYIRGIKPCRLWLSDDFWPNFFSLEYKDEIKNKDDKLNLLKFNYNESTNINYVKDDETILFETICFTAEIMIKLKLSKKFIIDIFNNKILNKYELSQDKINLLIQHIIDMFNKL